LCTILLLIKPYINYFCEYHQSLSNHKLMKNGIETSLNKAFIFVVLFLFSSLGGSCKDKATTLPTEPTITESPDLPPLPAKLYSYTSGTSAYFNVYQKLSEEDSLYTQFKIYHQHSTVR